MDATRAIIRRILTENHQTLDAIELFDVMRPGYKGFYAPSTGWVTWQVKWPEGIPHHEDIIENRFPEDLDYVTATVSISPRRLSASSSPGADKWEVNILYYDEDMWDHDMRMLVESVGVVDHRSKLYIDLSSGENSFDGTIQQYLYEWEERL